MHQYSIRLETVRYLCRSCLLPAFDDASVTFLRLSDVSVICRVTYFQFPIQVCYFSMLVSHATQRRTWFTKYLAQRRTWFTKYWTSNVAENLSSFLYRAYSPGEWFWIDFNGNGKMVTRHPVEGSFGSEFRAICNHCVAWRHEVARRWNVWEFFAFF